MNYKKLYPNVPNLRRGTYDSAGLDLYNMGSWLPDAPPFTLPEFYFRGDIAKISTGVAIEIPEGHFGLVRLRSSIASKRNMVLMSSGIIDADYRGEILVPVTYNGLNDVWEVNATQDNPSKLPGIALREKFAQIVIIPYAHFSPVEVDELGSTERGSGGFGSTGV